jgi:two-component sensor histidine kinase
MARKRWRDMVAALRGAGLAGHVAAGGCLTSRASSHARRSFTLRQHLFVLVLAASVPLITLAAFVSVDRFYAERQANRTSLMVNARALAASVDSELDKYLAIIHTLSKSPALLNGDLRQFWQEAKDASAFAPGTWIIVGDRNHQQLANTLRPYSEQLPLRAARPWIDLAFATKQPQVSDVFRGAAADRPVVSIEVPILRDGAPLYSLAISLGLDRFHDLLVAQKYPPGWLVGILDRSGRFVARIPEHEKRAGTLASEGWREAIMDAREGWGEHMSLERERVLTAYSTGRHAWIAGISVPESLLYASAWRSMRLVSIIGSTLLALSLGLAWFASSRIAKPADLFEAAADEMSRGKAPAIEKTGVKEFDGVVKRFEAAAAEIRQRAEHQQLLLNELRHRVKNILAVVQSLAVRTLSDPRSISDARNILVQRIHALGRVHEHLMRSDWKGANIRDIIAAELEPFSPRVNMEGPDLVVGGNMVQTLALLLHELATNAAKYGSLSNERGKVSINWSVVGKGRDARFKLRWEERDGPAVKRPTHKGFGTTLLESAIASDLKPRLSYPASGFTYELETPLDHIAPSALQ